MAQKRRGIIMQTDKEAALEKLRIWRSAATFASSKFRPGSPEYRSAERAMSAMDDLAESLTGDRTILRPPNMSDVPA